MAAFSSFQHHHSFPLDSSLLFLPNSPSPINGQPNSPLSPIPQFFQIQENPHRNLDQIGKKVFSSSGPAAMIMCNNNEPSAVRVTNKNSSTTMDTSSIVTDNNIYSCDQRLITQEVGNLNMDNNNNSNKKRKSKVGSSANSGQSKVMKREVNRKKEKKMKSDEEEKKRAEKEGPTGYIHVRARRGQATDSHSLAERVRREKISERMKLLQAIVPGCDKVTGKALMLDEIINYVQSLQNQVEFLSMKLASASPMYYDFGIDLDSFMVRPHQACSPTTANNYLDNSANNFFLFQQAQIPNALPQGSRQGLWEVDELRQKNMNQLEIEQHPLFFPLI